MTDRNGNELKVGDWVCYSFKRALFAAKINKILRESRFIESVRIDHEIKSTDYRNLEEIRRFGESLVKLPDDENLREEKLFLLRLEV